MLDTSAHGSVGRSDARLVTGANGHVGSNLCRALVDRGHAALRVMTPEGISTVRGKPLEREQRPGEG